MRPDFQQYRLALHVLGLCVCGLRACSFVSGILSSPARLGPPSTLWPVAVTGSFLSLCRQSFIKETTLHKQDRAPPRCPQGGPLLPCFRGARGVGLMASQSERCCYGLSCVPPNAYVKVLTRTRLCLQIVFKETVKLQ